MERDGRAEGEGDIERKWILCISNKRSERNRLGGRGEGIGQLGNRMLSLVSVAAFADNLLFAFA